MSKWFKSGNSGNPWILNALKTTMGIPATPSVPYTPSSNTSSIGNALAGQTNQGGNFLSNFGKNLIGQSSFGQSSNKIGKVLGGDFKGAVSGGSTDQEIFDLFKKYQR